MLRAPAFFEDREQLLRPVVDELSADQLQPELVAKSRDVEEARDKATQAVLGDNERFKSMLTRAVKVAGILAHMQWQIVRFDGPVLVFSDQPVVLWPVGLERTSPFERPRFGPLTALEVRVPIAPDSAVLMTWIDQPGSDDTRLPPRAAAELNAFSASQADREWMRGLDRQRSARVQ